MDDETVGWQFLHSLWTDRSLEGIQCVECGQDIPKDVAFARTFTLSATATDHTTRMIEVPGLGLGIQLFNRHLTCLYDSVSYVAISHVWNAQVADLQYKKDQSPVSAVDVATTVREVPARICLSLLQGLQELEDFEIWHDYLSVPQWADQVKPGILQEISTLFSRAKVVVAFLADIAAVAFDEMRYGNFPIDRARGAGHVCSALWFTRVWTAMEYIHSTELRIMAKDYELIAADDEDRPITHELNEAWRDVTKRFGSARRVEDEVGRGYGIRYPWQLGPIIPVRLDKIAGTPTCFAVVHSVLSRRHVTVPTDFFYALEGIIGTKGIGEPYGDPAASMVRLALHRLLEGDFSPLFMVPTTADTGMSFDFGFTDLATWGVGVQESPPMTPSIQVWASERKAVVQAEEIGIVHFIRRVSSRDGPLPTMGKLCRVTFEATGLDADAFATTLGARLYGQSIDAIKRRLSAEGRRQHLHSLLCQLCDAYTGEDLEIVSTIADVIGLSNTSLDESHEDPQTPMDMLSSHGGTLHHTGAAAIVGVRCQSCHRMFLLRVALFRPASCLIGTKAYRVPGLKYRWSHAGGMGWLLDEGHMGGRFVWGTPTCACKKLCEVGITIDHLPTPSCKAR